MYCRDVVVSPSFPLRAHPAPGHPDGCPARRCCGFGPWRPGCSSLHLPALPLLGCLPGLV